MKEKRELGISPRGKNLVKSKKKENFGNLANNLRKKILVEGASQLEHQVRTLTNKFKPMLLKESAGDSKLTNSRKIGGVAGPKLGVRLDGQKDFCRNQQENEKTDHAAPEPANSH